MRRKKKLFILTYIGMKKTHYFWKFYFFWILKITGKKFFVIYALISNVYFNKDHTHFFRHVQFFGNWQQWFLLLKWLIKNYKAKMETRDIVRTKSVLQRKTPVLSVVVLEAVLKKASLKILWKLKGHLCWSFF